MLLHPICTELLQVLIDEENGPTLTYALQNHFGAIAMKEGRTKKTSVHHQSLVTISRRYKDEETYREFHLLADWVGLT